MSQFAIKDDITSKVAERWKDVEKKDVDDLLRCFVEYLNKSTKSDEHYAYDFPYLGKMYLKLNKYEKGATPLAVETLKDILFNSPNYEKHPSYRRSTLYRIRTKDMTNEELMYRQNNAEQD